MGNLMYIDTILGRIGIGEDGRGITAVFFPGESPPTGYVENETPLLNKTADEIKEYLMGKRKVFDVPLSLHGTEFQMKDWEALSEIPYGETRCYEDIAIRIGKPKACRAVGLANNRNPVSIIIPCHRVIGKNGKMTGYGGGIPIKEFLLKLERDNK